jgi:transcription initiation factor TFIIIB Brf1 subunit/transcription initiation factor TFIIB
MSTPETTCPHKGTQVIAKDDEAQYIECLDCGEILEVGEWKDGSRFNESLSDA